jgi:hypothetical protein
MTPERQDLEVETVEEGDEVVIVGSGDDLGYGQPSRAPRGSLWAQQAGIDFFLPPALSLEVLDYLHINGEGPVDALRERFGLAERENGGPPAKAPENRDTGD